MLHSLFAKLLCCESHDNCLFFTQLLSLMTTVCFQTLKFKICTASCFLCVYSCACIVVCTQIMDVGSRSSDNKGYVKASMRRQKRKFDDADDDGDCGGGANVSVAELKQSLLVEHLLTQFAWGHMTPQQVQQIANLTVQDFNMLCTKLGNTSLDLGDLQKIAKAGTSGRFSNNVHRDIMKIINEKIHMPQLYTFNMEIKGTVPAMQTDMMLPHELFAHMYTHYPEAFAKTFLGDVHVGLGAEGKSKCKQFWDSVQKHPCFHKSCLETELHRECTIPFCLHGDGTPITGRGKSWSKQHTIFSMSSLLTKGCTKDCQIMLFGIWDHLMKDNSVHTAMEVMTWSFYHLYLGIWPRTPHDSIQRSHISIAFSELFG